MSERDPLIAATLSYISQQVANAGGSLQTLTEGDAEHEQLKDHTKNPYHEILTQHGFVHKSTEHKKNRFNPDNPKADYTEHRYEHPGHGKSHVIVTQNHSKGGGGYSYSDDKGHSFIHRHEQENGIMSPSSGNSKPQLHRSLSYHYGVPKGVKPPPLTAWERNNPHGAPKYKQNEEETPQMNENVAVYKELAAHLKRNHGKNSNDVLMTDYSKIPGLKVHASDTNGTSGIGKYKGYGVNWSHHYPTGEFRIEPHQRHSGGGSR